MSASLPDHAETQACTLEMKFAFGQKHDVSLFDLQLGATDNHEFKHDGSTDGQGAFGGGGPFGGA